MRESPGTRRLCVYAVNTDVLCYLRLGGSVDLLCCGRCRKMFPIVSVVIIISQVCQCTHFLIRYGGALLDAAMVDVPQ